MQTGEKDEGLYKKMGKKWTQEDIEYVKISKLNCSYVTMLAGASLHTTLARF